MPFPTDSAIWNIKQTHWDSGTPWHSPIRMEMKGDTIQNGKIYSKIYGNFGTLMGLLREESKKIYYQQFSGSFNFQDTTEYLLFDFNLEIGDTFVIYHKVINGINDTLTLDTFYTSVTNIDEIELNNGEFRRRLWLEDSGNSCGSMQWVEGIGNIAYHPIYTNVFCFEDVTVLLCHSVGNDTIYGDCPMISSVKVGKEPPLITVYPNPVQDRLYIENSNNVKELLFTVYDLQGNVLKKGRTFNNSIDISFLPAAAYFLRLNDKSKHFGLMKFVKQ